MKKDKFVLREKQFRKLLKRSNQLQREIRTKKWRELKEPYQDGWTLYLGLRADASRRDDAHLLLTAINHCAYETYIKDPKLVSKIRSNPSLEAVRKLFPEKSGWINMYDFHGRMPFMNHLTKEKYDKLPEELKRFYYCSVYTEPARWGMEERKVERYHLSVPNYYIIVKIKKRVVTHVQDINPELLKEDAELDRLLAPYFREGKNSYKYDDCWYSIRDPMYQRAHWKEVVSKLKTSEIEEPGDCKNFKSLK